MKVLMKLLRPLSFVPALAMLYLIFGFSSQSGEASASLSYRVSYELVSVKDKLQNTHKDDETLSYEASVIHPYVRKAAHLSEYFLLAILTSLPLYVYGIRGLWLFLLVGAFSLAVAGFDEYHQSFVKNRGPSLSDVGIDGIGSLLGALLVQAFCWSVTHNPTTPSMSNHGKRLS